MGKMVAYFTYYGSSFGKDKDVILSIEEDDTHTVSIEGYPSLTKKNLSLEKGLEVLEGFQNMSVKDWGSSETYFSEDFRARSRGR